MRHRSITAFFLILLLAFSSSSPAVTSDEERKYGKEINKEILQAVPVNNDLYISLQAQSIKSRLEANGTLPFPVTLTIMDTPTADAFTTMGGYVYISTGLIALCDKEEELAGVIAHEMGHIKKRHVAKQMEQQKYLNIGMLTTMLLAIVAGNSTAGGAIMTSGLAGIQAMALKYSREDEEEADREGSVMADKSGYGGLGSADFLKKLRITGTDKLLPQYLLTHPYHDERIVALESMWPQNRVSVPETLFPYLVLRAQVLHQPRVAGSDDMTINRYRKDMNNPVNNYAVSLIYSLKGDNAASISAARESTSPFKNLFLAEMYISARQFQSAADILVDDGQPIARFLLGRAYEGLGKNEMAIAAFRELLSYGSAFPDIYYRLGMLYGRAGQEGRGYEYLGRFYMDTGKFPLAKTNFEKAISRYGINSPEAGVVMKLLESMKEGKK